MFPVNFIGFSLAFHKVEPRARIHCCKRNWKAAKYDFVAVLQLDPGHEAASRGLADIDADVDELPMLSRSILDL